MLNVKSVWNTQKKIERLTEKKQALLDTLTLHGVSYDQIKAGQHGKNQNSAVEDLIIAVENIDAEIAQVEERKVKLQAFFLKLFDRLLPDNVAPIFIYRYVNLTDWKTIAKKVGYSDSHTWNLNKKYLSKVEATIKNVSTN